MDGQTIIELRNEENITRKELAEVLGITSVTLSKYECGASKIPAIILGKIQFLMTNKDELRESIRDIRYYSDNNYVNSYSIFLDTHNRLLATVRAADEKGLTYGKYVGEYGVVSLYR